MNINKQEWDATEAADMQGFKRLPAGGYVCKIINAKEDLSETNNIVLRLALEICEGEYAGYFSQDYAHLVQKYPDAKWPCTYTQVTTGNGLRFFKGLIEAVKMSNPDFIMDIKDDGSWDEKTLKGRLIGVVFRDEFYTGKNGKTRTKAMPRYIRDVETIRKGHFTIPEPRRNDYLSQNVSNEYPEDEEIPF